MIVEPIRDDSGRVTGLACAAIDLTDRRRAERERDHLLDSERAARADAERAGRDERRIPGHAVARAADAAQRDAGLGAGAAAPCDGRACGVLRGLQVIERNVRTCRHS